jgi:hypothetical protein
MGRLGSNQLGTHQLGGEGFVPPDKQVWRVIRNGDELESDLYDAEITDTANPFGNFAIAYLDDTSGNKFDQYERGTRVDFEVSTDGGVNFSRRFSGYVVEAREQNQQGADSLEVEAYSFDQFLRRSTVSEDQSGRTISAVLENIVKNDTPVKWNAANVDVIDDRELTRSYRGELVENVLQSLASASANEGFGVNDTVEFFFRPDEVENAPRDIDNSQWFDYDIPKQGKETVNQVTVFYDGGKQSVTVDNGGDKTKLQNSLGTQDPVTLEQEVSRPAITKLIDAQAVGEQILNDRKSTLTGTVTTFGLTEATPGDVINITINERGINDEFRIAQIEYLWGRGETRLTIVQKKGDQDEMLVRLSDSVQRLETEDVDRDGAGNFITSTQVGATLSISGNVDRATYNSAAATNELLNQLLDGWAGDGNVEVSELAVGNGTRSASRSDESLANELERVAVSQSLPDEQSVLFKASASTTDIREVGLFDSAGELLARSTIPSTNLSTPVDLEFRLDITNDDSIDNGVVTLDGQTSVRDVLADNNPALPSDYAYGEDGTQSSQSDAVLGSQLQQTDIDTVNVQFADTDAEFDAITGIGQQQPIRVDSGKIELLQSTWLEEAENADNLAPLYTDVGDLSGDEGRELAASGDFVEIDITPQYEIPADELDTVVWANFYNGFSGELTTNFDGNKLRETTYNNRNGVNERVMGFNGVNNSALSPGTTHTFQIIATSNPSGEFVVDMMAAWDDRQQINDTPSFDTNTASFDGPEIYTDVVDVTFDEISTIRKFDFARVVQQWNNTDNNQYIELSNDGGNTFIRSNNTSQATASFANLSQKAQCRIGVSRYTANSVTTPTNGDSGQEVDLHSLDVNVNSINSQDIGVANLRVIVSEGVIAGETIREAGQLDQVGNLLTRATFAEHDVEANEQIVSSESIRFSNS